MMKINKQNQYKLIFSIVLFIVIIDQLTKLLIRSSFSVGESKTLIPAVLEIVHVQNTGIAFGLLKDMSLVMIILNILIICAILFYAKAIKSRKLATYAGIILGGAFGNLIDRLFFGTITDFIKISIWPVFNVADAYVTVGAILLAVYFMKKKD